MQNRPGVWCNNFSRPGARMGKAKIYLDVPCWSRPPCKYCGMDFVVPVGFEDPPQPAPGKGKDGKDKGKGKGGDFYGKGKDFGKDGSYFGKDKGKGGGKGGFGGDGKDGKGQKGQNGYGKGPWSSGMQQTRSPKAPDISKMLFASLPKELAEQCAALIANAPKAKPGPAVKTLEQIRKTREAASREKTAIKDKTFAQMEKAKLLKLKKVDQMGGAYGGD